MNRKRTVKRKPPTGQGRGGKSENQRGGDVFSIQDNTTNPLLFQDFNRQADIYSLRSEYWKLMSDACEILMILQVAEVDHE